MDLGLEGRVALVTASSKGLGRASAQALSQEGAKVVLCARDGRALEEAAAAMPGEALAVPADVTDPGTPARLVAAAVERFGGLHVLVANAGGPPPGRALEVTDDALLAAIDANLLASIRLVRCPTPPAPGCGRGPRPKDRQVQGDVGLWWRHRDLLPSKRSAGRPAQWRPDCAGRPSRGKGATGHPAPASRSSSTRWAIANAALAAGTPA